MNPKPIIAIVALFGALWILIAAPALRRTSITDRVAQALETKGYGDVQVSIADRHVYLWGNHRTAGERAAAERIAEEISGVTGVSNFVGIQDDLMAALETSATLKGQLGETIAQLKSTENSLAAMETRAEMTAAQLKDTQTLLKDTRMMLSEKEQQLAAFKAAWSDEKSKLEGSLTEKSAENNLLRKTLSESRVLLTEARRVLAARDQEFTRESANLRQAIAAVTKELEETKAALTAATGEKDVLASKAVELEKNLAAAKDQVMKLDMHRAETEALLVEVRKVLAARDKEYSQQSQQLAAAEKSIADLKAKLEQANVGQAPIPAQ
jgi:chromosome segregation ATPase